MIRGLVSCCVVLGMWQVAGGHGKIDQKKAVEEMKRYAFAGLGVFDLADICEFVTLWDPVCWIVSLVDSLQFCSKI
jgi:cytochrome oxidase assembly protein ShyY1